MWGQRGNTGKTWKWLLEAPFLSGAESQKHMGKHLAEDVKGRFAPLFLCTAWPAGQHVAWAGKTGQAGGEGVNRTGRHLQDGHICKQESEICSRQQFCSKI